MNFFKLKLLFTHACIYIFIIFQPAHISNHTHHRTKSSPDPLTIISPGESSRRLIASESLNDLSRTNENWENAATPPGTPPPPYPSPLVHRKHVSSNRNSANTEDGDSYHDEVSLKRHLQLNIYVSFFLNKEHKMSSFLHNSGLVQDYFRDPSSVTNNLKVS